MLKTLSHIYGFKNRSKSVEDWGASLTLLRRAHYTSVHIYLSGTYTLMGRERRMEGHIMWTRRMCVLVCMKLGICAFGSSVYINFSVCAREVAMCVWRVSESVSPCVSCQGERRDINNFCHSADKMVAEDFPWCPDDCWRLSTSPVTAAMRGR